MQNFAAITHPVSDFIHLNILNLSFTVMANLQVYVARVFMTSFYWTAMISESIFQKKLSILAPCAVISRGQMFLLDIVGAESLEKSHF